MITPRAEFSDGNKRMQPYFPWRTSFQVKRWSILQAFNLTQSWPCWPSSICRKGKLRSAILQGSSALTKQSVKQLITLMENNGYVRTVPSRRDKRAVNVTIRSRDKKSQPKTMTLVGIFYPISFTISPRKRWRSYGTCSRSCTVSTGKEQAALKKKLAGNNLSTGEF